MKIGYIKDITNDSSPLINKMKKKGVSKIILSLDNVQDISQKDILVVRSLDDLGDTLTDIINVLQELYNNGNRIEVLEHLDNTIKIKEWDIKQLLVVLMWVRIKETNEILRRQSEGMNIIKALKDQKRPGRPKKYSKDAKNKEDRDIYFHVKYMLDNKVPIKRISDTLNITRNTIYTIRDEELVTEIKETENKETN